LETSRAKNLQTTRDAELANAGLLLITTYDDHALQGMAEAFLHSLAHLVGAGSTALLYVYAWHVKSAAGIRATDPEVERAERCESLNTFRTNPKPLVRVHDDDAVKGWRIVKDKDIFSPAHAAPATIERAIVTARLSDVQFVEQYLHHLLRADPPGFRGNIREGGTGKMGGPYLFGVSVLVMPAGLTAMGLAVREDHRDAFTAACDASGGRLAGIELPPRPRGPFPPKDPRGGFVLGGPIMETARGLVTL
jgi:hypothetical protein